MSVQTTEIHADPEVIAAWQSHFDEGVTDDKDAMTAAELALVTGISSRVMQRRLTEGVQAGEYTVGKAYRMDTMGRRQLVPVYKLVKKPRGKRGRAKTR